MEQTFKAWSTGRRLCLDVLNNYSLEQLNKIPEGFSNNLAWNLGHIIVAQQMIVYKGSGLSINIPDAMVEQYKPGTKPTEAISQAEADELKTLLLSLIPKTEADHKKGLFTTYTERTTITGFHLGSIEDAVEFNNYHEGLHLGMMMSIRKFV